GKPAQGRDDIPDRVTRERKSCPPRNVAAGRTRVREPVTRKIRLGEISETYLFRGECGRHAESLARDCRSTHREMDGRAGAADGSKVAHYAVRAGRSELWERSITEGQDRLLLSSLDWRFASPRWSPDGAKLAFSRCAARDHSVAVAVLNADSGAERVLTKPDVEMGVSDWSKDGQAILGACRFSKSDRYSTCVIPLRDDGRASDVRVIASDPTRNLFNQRFSPDQRWISFLAHDLSYESTSTVYVISTGGGAWRPM